MSDLPSISGVAIQPLEQIVDERGAVLHMLRADSPLFKAFGEIYFSLVLPGVVKGWKRHQRLTQHFAVPVGQIRLVLFDDRPDSPSLGRLVELLVGQPDHYYLVRIPPMLWYGFQGLGSTPALVANCTDFPHDPQEAESLPLGTPRVPYVWKE